MEPDRSMEDNMSKTRKILSKILLLAILAVGAISYHSYKVAAPDLDYTGVVPE